MLSSQRAKFQLPKDVSYLNAAYMSPLMTKIIDIGKTAVSLKGLPYEIRTNDFFSGVQELKNAFARLINAKNPDRVVLHPSASYGIASVAKNVALKAGQNILMVDEQFPSNYYSWEKLAKEQDANIQLIKPAEGPNRGKFWNEKILAAIDQNTAMITLGNVHWADGTLFDLKAIREKTREVGALMIIDASQSLGALPLDVEQLQPDALISVTYKWLLGAFGMSLAYMGPVFDQGSPLEENWINRKGSDNFQNLVNYQPAYQPGAGRYGMGQPSNFITVPMVTAALQQIEEWGIANIQQYATDLSAPFIPQLKEMGCKIEDKDWRGGHLLGIRFSEQYFDHEKLKANLAKRKVYTSARGNAIRVSTEVYNEVEDWEKLLECFKESRR